ncbi:hypothetical protein BX666DRAFT_1886167 [Dichotomocladium elegans]|nr:hypothetical protein BX666DRAFT_1886167 [Dichotomocladium elegans]
MDKFWPHPRNLCQQHARKSNVPANGSLRTTMGQSYKKGNYPKCNIGSLSLSFCLLFCFIFMNTLEVPIITPDNMPRLGKIKPILHIGEFILSILTLCTVAPIIAIEIRFYEGSQAAPNWTLVVTILTWWIPVMLIYFPWAYHHHNKFRRIGKFCMKPRTNLIFSVFGTVLWAVAGIAMTVHATNPSHCTLDTERTDQAYASSWPAQCNCARAAAAFSWLNCLLWLASLVCSIIVSWNEKQLARQTRNQHEEAKLEQANIAEGEEETTTTTAAAVLPPHHLQQDKYEVPPQTESSCYHQHLPPSVIPINTSPSSPFYQLPVADPYGMPVPPFTPPNAAGAAPPPPPLSTQNVYNSVPHYHHHQ